METNHSFLKHLVCALQRITFTSPVCVSITKTKAMCDLWVTTARGRGKKVSNCMALQDSISTPAQSADGHLCRKTRKHYKAYISGFSSALSTYIINSTLEFDLLVKITVIEYFPIVSGITGVVLAWQIQVTGGHCW